ncbi:CatB-related O-acetyltransferase [Aeromicrobium choanae]|uniref:Acetyltransferase (Isoleucine patch superfamily) n=1 Tax=Aeromicrobium choanae TaxID=1736691 RepID=A0A1T4YZV0_9ACTN|nr:CatB-related O-acetyltransferase [Aeromicrobium choanae]SKB07319.1 Acetyltransferase (isoleucine patch superfamily) [Aeromicrobium choanae]
MRIPDRAAAKLLAHRLITRWKLGEPAGHRRVAHDCKISGPVTIGDYTYIGGRSEIRAVLSSITIGRYCSIGRDVKVFSSGQAHRFDGLSTYPFYVIDREVERRHYNVETTDTTIGNDVWIGSNSIIQAGVTIGDGAVIGAASVVTRDVAPYSIVAGVPARQIGTRFDDGVAAAVAESQWWLLDHDRLMGRAGHLLRTNAALRDPEQLRF